MKVVLYNINSFNTKNESYLQRNYPGRYDFSLRFENYKDYLRSMSSFYLLDKYLGSFNEDDLYKGDNGKPYIKGKIFFNYSHSGDYIAFAKDKNEVGVDIQEIDKSHTDIISKYFTNKEQDICNKDTEKNFAKIWSKKEAVIKLFGESVISNLKEFDVSTSETEYRGQKIYVAQEFFKDYSVALASFSRQNIEISEAE